MLKWKEQTTWKGNKELQRIREQIPAIERRQGKSYMCIIGASEDTKENIGGGYMFKT